MATRSTAAEAAIDHAATVTISAHHRSVRKLGHWTTARRIEVRAVQGSVILDLRSPRIDPGDIEIELDVERSMIKLLVPDGAVVDHAGLHRAGRCGLVDWGGGGDSEVRLIRVTGEIRTSELRINRGGIAIASAMLTAEYVADLRRAYRENRIGSLKDMQDAYREGRWTTIEDPGRSS